MKSETVDKVLIGGAVLLGGFALWRVAAPVVRQVEGAVKGATNAAFGNRPTTTPPASTGAKPTYGAPTAPVPKEQAPDTEAVPTDAASVAARAAGAAAYAKQGGNAYTDTAGAAPTGYTASYGGAPSTPAEPAASSAWTDYTGG